MNTISTTTLNTMNDQAADAITLEGVNDKLKKFEEANANDIQEWIKNHPVNVAKLYVKCDTKAATINFELRKLASNSSLGAESSARLRRSLEKDLESVTASRKLGEICEALVIPASEWAQASMQEAEATKALEATATLESALAAEAAPLRERDVRGDSSSLEALMNEEGWINGILESGQWRHTSRDFQPDALANELEKLLDQGKYNGALTKEGAEARLVILAEEIARIQLREESALTAFEVGRLKGLEEKIGEATAAVNEAKEQVATLSAITAERREAYERKMEIARIVSGGVIEIHQINCQKHEVCLEAV